MKRLVSTATILLACSLSALYAAESQNQAAPAKPPSAPQQGAVMSAGGQQSAIRPVPENFRFANGQVLHYTAEWRLLSAGTATLKLDRVGEEEHVSATADASGAVSVLYRVADRFDSYFDHKSFCSSRIMKHSEEGLHRRETKIEFDYTRKKSVLDERNLKTNETKHTEQDIPVCVTDVLSGIYYVGSMPLEPGSKYVFPLNDGGKTYDVNVNVEAREELKTEAGTFKTIRVQPASENGLLKTRGKIWIWYSDDAAHIPVQMRARMFWGTLTFRLIKVDRQP